MERKHQTLKTIGLIVLVLALMVLIIFLVGKAFGFFQYAKKGEVANVIGVKGLEVEVLNENDDALNLTGTYPMFDQQGLALTPFEFNIINPSTKTFDISLLVESDTEKQDDCVIEGTNTPCTALSTSYIRYSYAIDDGVYSTPANLGENEEIIYNTRVNPNQTIKVSLKIWIDKDAPNDIQGNVFFGKLVINGVRTAPMKELILKNNPIITTAPTLNNSINNTSDASGLYAMDVVGGYSNGTDGTSYYFRGNVTADKVEFAGKEWKILRINEDGTIRIMLNESVSTSPINSTRNSYTNMYYSNGDGAKASIESWYETNIVGAGYDSYVASGNYFCESAKIKYDSTATSGSATSVVYSSYTPDLTCPTDGNGKGLLDLSVGLITYDEMVLAGGYFMKANSSYHLYTNYQYHSMTPGGFSSSSNARVWRVNADGGLEDSNVNNALKLLPVVNLKANTLAIYDSVSETYIVQ